MAPRLGRQDSIISIEKYAKLWHGPPSVTWAEGLSTETVGEDLFWPKTGLTLSEDLFFFFFFGLHLISGRKRTWFWAGKFSFWSSLISNFLNFLPPPFSKILRTLLSPNMWTSYILVNACNNRYTKLDICVRIETWDWTLFKCPYSSAFHKPWVAITSRALCTLIIFDL